MANFKTYFNSNFSGCKLVATGYDSCRQRDVRMYLIPGEVEVVGVSDTVDKWIAPLSSPFLERLAKAVADHFAGNNPAFPVILGTPPGEQGGQKRARKQLIDPEPPSGSPRPRRTLLVDPEQPQPTPRRRVLI